ncbi:zinc finger MYM-type protein 1-like [Impatiens glandulifera]|uniref:zinc finger MYM-type protein 1-like n=1 Tax=Impatiens glandulifera TaxID=253017 RepID=UPI001FB10869|nr:zinc finger MYM-type protein 1-like [Impatiens glandulifera]
MQNAKIPARLQSPYMMKNKERNQHYFESSQIDYRDEIIMGFIFANEDDKNVRITMDNERSKKRKTLLSFFKHKENSSTSTVNEKSPINPSFTIDGFNNWKRVNDGVKCPLLIHVGGPTSSHSNSVKCVEDLMKVSGHIDNILNAQSLDEVQKNRLRLKTTIESIRWLSLQACAFRGHDESSSSKNSVLEKAPRNATYTSPTIQKEILHIFANKVRKNIREEIGDAKFCILVNEAKDISNKEQMSIILRFVDCLGILRERFFDIVNVPNTTASTLKKSISDVLSRHNLNVTNMRGQGLQLALVGASTKEISVWLFFSKLSTIINLIGCSSKWHSELHSAQTIEIDRMITSGEQDTSKGMNQIDNLHRSGSTRWSSHFESICSLIDMFGATISVLESIVEEGSSSSLRGEACVSTTKALLFNFREEGFDHLLEYVQMVCTQHDIEIPDLNASYKSATRRSCQQKDSLTIQQHYHFNIFNSVIDFQQEELNSRFSDEAIELLKLSSALDLKDNFKSFKGEDICKLAEKYYPGDFSEQEMHYLRSQLQHYKN